MNKHAERTHPCAATVACSLGLSATSQQYFSLRTNQPPATSRNQPAVLVSQNKPAPAISHQPTEQAAGSVSAKLCTWRARSSRLYMPSIRTYVPALSDSSRISFYSLHQEIPTVCPYAQVSRSEPSEQPCSLDSQPSHSPIANDIVKNSVIQS
jgi:hypothetical protein